MAEFREIELFVVMDASGDIGLGTDEENAVQHYRDNIDDSEPLVRTMHVKLKVEVPEPTVLTGTVPCSALTATLAVEEA